MRTALLPVLLGGIVVSWGAADAQDDLTPRAHTETITEAEHAWTVTMGGTLDGPSTRDPIGYAAWTQAFEPMRVVRIANVGDTVVVNPWLFTGERGHWRTVQELVEHVTAPYGTEVEQATALWWWETRHRWHFTTGDRHNNDPIKVWNIFGHTLCGNDAFVLADCWRTLGLRTRHPRIQGHSISEVWADGGWRLLDGDENINCLLRDNITPAAEADIRRDHDLIKRTHCYGILRPDSRQIDEFSASLYAHDEQPAPDRDLPSNIGHEMKFSLRPGEALVWAWEHAGKFYCPWDYERVVDRIPPMVCNGWWEFTPRLTEARVAEDAESASGLSENDGTLRAGPEGGELVYRLSAPYAMVGGKLTVGAQGAVAAELSWDGQEWLPLTAEASDHGLVMDLDEHFPFKGELRLDCLLRLRLEPGTVLRIVNARMDLQMAPLCMPYLELGENAIRYVDETPGPRQVEVTHEWVETGANRPPTAPAAPLTPADGAQLDRTQFVFEWRPATDPDGDEIADYQFMLSAYPDMRWPLSPNFFKLVSHTADAGTASYTVPYRGLLNPGTTYYWRVRARDGRRAWGAWSDVWEFTPGGPGIPLNLARRVDEDARTVTISWQDNTHGTRPVRYKVYGSDEKGFTVSDTEYQVWVGNQEPEQGWQTWSGNLMSETTGRSIQVVGADLDLENANRAFYRVVAIDANGVESGPSDYIEMPRPLIHTRPPMQVTAGGEYSYPARTISSIGDLRCRTINPGESYNARYWDVEHPVFSLVEAPAWLTIDAETGEVSGTAPAQAGEHTVAVRVEIEGVGEDVQRFVLSVR